MALRSKESWTNFIIAAGIPPEESATYATAFVDNRLTESSLPELSKEYLKDLGITIIGDIITILKHIQTHLQTSNSSTTNSTLPRETVVKSNIPPPQLHADMTHPQFRKFKIDWDVYKKISNVPVSNLPAQLYHICDDTLQNSIVNTIPNFFTSTEADILDILEKIVTKRSNPAVHRLTFSNIYQSDNESIKDYLVRLKTIAMDCEFSCPNCHHDLLPTHVKDQFIRGLHNNVLQTDILAKADRLASLEDIVKHSEAFEIALHDQQALQQPSPIHAARISDYKKNKQPSNKRPCSGCGSLDHQSFERSRKCPAWGKSCLNCSNKNHYANVCRQPKQTESANALIAQVSQPYQSKTTGNQTTEIPAELTFLSPNNNTQFQPKSVLIFPDSGASICIAGTKHLPEFGIDKPNLIPCNKTITAVGGSTLTCHGFIPTQFNIGAQTTQLPLYICDKVDKIYFSRQGCTDTNIISKSFPYPMTNETTHSISTIKTSQNKPQSREPPPVRPHQLPYLPTPENVPLLEKYLLEKFSKSAFNKSSPFPAMTTKPAHIHLRPDSKPYAHHVPIPIPYHWKTEVKASIDKDVTNQIIEPVPIGEPVEWCSKMIVIPKKDGRPRRTVDLQQLNSQCQRETHHCQSPFQLACQVPVNSKKTVLDAVDGFHAIPLDDESKPLTTFITEWGRYRSLRLPQGYLAASDAYTRRYDDIIKNVQQKVKCVDDTLLWDPDIETAFYHTWDYLTLCANNGIVINKDKFQFCRDEVLFAGLKLTPTGIKPSDHIISAIRDFPTPKTITDARSWFGLVNQVAWSYAISPTMQPFRELVKPNTKFHWDTQLDKLFNESKQILISNVIDGISTFDVNKKTCLQTDWSKEGIGYLLLQQHCDCNTEKAPSCSENGWKLIYAGSRFTHETESRYAPTEGEALAVSWSLEHSKMFTLGSENLIISTDHRPLLGIFNNKELNSINNPRICNLKEKTLKFKFTIQYNPGKWHRGPDACSRNPTLPAPKICHILADNPTNIDISKLEYIETIIETNVQHHIESFNDTNNHTDNKLIFTHEALANACISDPQYNMLIQTIQSGFPASKSKLDAILHEYWEVRDRLITFNNFILLEDRLVLPKSIRKHALSVLHSAHQGVTNMQARAKATIYWPGMNADIRNTRYTCQKCNEFSPSQPKEPIIPSPAPQYPFQMVCADYFEVSGHYYFVYVDRFSAWLSIFHFKPHQATTNTLKTECRSLFENYGAPEEFGSDGGPQFTSTDFGNFLKDWGIHHRLSSAGYPQSNGRAELAVKAAKRIIRDNTSSNGSLDTNKAARAILQYRNTPLPGIELSPAQILFHRQLRDHLPTNPIHYQLHKDWLITAEEREKHFSQHTQKIINEYNNHSHALKPLPIRSQVLIQSLTMKNKLRWTQTGTIVEILPFRQYKIRLDGSGRIVLRNRRHLKPCHIINPSIIPSADTLNPQPNITPPEQPATADVNHNPEPIHAEPIPNPVNPNPPVITKTPRALKNIANYNRPGLSEQNILPPRRGNNQK